MRQWCFFVIAEAHGQRHSLQTAQNLLQEEVARAEEHSEVKDTQKKTKKKHDGIKVDDSWKAYSIADSPPTSVQSDLYRHEAVKYNE